MVRNIGKMLRSNPKQATRILYEVIIQAKEAFFPSEIEEVDRFFKMMRKYKKKMRIMRKLSIIILQNTITSQKLLLKKLKQTEESI